MDTYLVSIEHSETTEEDELEVEGGENSGRLPGAQPHVGEEIDSTQDTQNGGQMDKTQGCFYSSSWP